MLSFLTGCSPKQLFEIHKPYLIQYNTTLFNTCIVNCLMHRNHAINLLYICYFMWALCYFRSANVNYIVAHTIMLRSAVSQHKRITRGSVHAKRHTF